MVGVVGRVEEGDDEVVLLQLSLMPEEVLSLSSAFASRSFLSPSSIICAVSPTTV